MIYLLVSIISLIPFITINSLIFTQRKDQNYRVAVIGASSGVGQQICAKFLQENCEVNAVGRNIRKLNELSYLQGSNKFELESSNKLSLSKGLEGVNSIVISVGTTAFPSKSWEGGRNNPTVACYESILNILDAVSSLKRKPSKIALISSIGVDRTEQFPFKVLNLFGVLREKRRAEQFLLKSCRKLNVAPIICRPGRLIGQPLTNLDLAKLLNIKRKENRFGIRIEKSSNDILLGDIARQDVAESLYYLLRAENRLLQKVYGDEIVYSIVNSEREEELTKREWENILLRN